MAHTMISFCHVDSSCISPKEDSERPLPVTSWFSRTTPEDSVVSAVMMIVGSRNRLKQTERIVFLRLRNDQIYFFFLISLVHDDVRGLIEAVGHSLESMAASSNGSTSLAGQVGYANGCIVEFIEKDPRCLNSWGLNKWQQQRIAAFAMSGAFKNTLAITDRVEDEVSRISALLQSDLTTFLSCVDQDACKSAAVPGVPWLDQYNYLTHQSQTIRRNRRQAIQIFPLLVAEMLLKNDQQVSLEKIAEAIDNGIPLVEAAAKIFQCKAVAVRRIRYLSEDEIGTSWRGNLRPLFFLLSKIPPEHYPSRRENWQALAEGASFIKKATGHPVMTVSSGIFIAEVARRRWRLDRGSQASMLERACSIEMLVNDLSRYLVIHLGLLKTDAIDARMHTHGVALETVFSLSQHKSDSLARRWSKMKRQFATEILVNPPSDFSLKLIDEPFQHGEVSIVQLLSPEQLKNESKVLKHCVEEYGELCRTGRALIFSLREPSGQPRSTIQLSVSERAPSVFEVALIQHKGRKNAVPCNEDMLAANSFLEHLRGPLCRTQLKAFCVARNLASTSLLNRKDYRFSLLLNEILVEATGGKICLDFLIDKALDKAKLFDMR